MVTIRHLHTTQSTCKVRDGTGAEGRYTGKVRKKRWWAVVVGHVRVGGGPHCLPLGDTDLRCCIEHALCSGDHRKSSRVTAQ